MRHIIIRSFLALLVGAGVVVSVASAEQAFPIKGEKVLNRAIHDDCKIPAPRVALQHSIAEWEALAKSGQMEAEIAKLCGRKTAIKPFRTKYSKYVAEYLEHYANDSGAIPA